MSTAAAAFYFLQTLPYARDGANGRAIIEFLSGRPVQAGHENLVEQIASSVQVPFGQARITKVSSVASMTGALEARLYPLLASELAAESTKDEVTAMLGAMAAEDSERWLAVAEFLLEADH